MESAADRLDSLIEREWEQGREVHVQVEVVSESAWSGQLRYTPEPNRADGPDRSFVFYAVGGADPDSIIDALLDDFGAWQVAAMREP